MRFLKSFFLTFLFVTSLTASVLETDVLIVTNDLGDMADLIEVADRLTKTQVSLKIAAIGTSAEKLGKDPRYVDLSSVCKLEARLKGKLDPSLRLAEKDVQNIRDSVKAKVCLIGMSHRVLADLSMALAPSTTVIAYYDNLDPMTKAAYVQPFLMAEKRVDFYLLPSQKTLEISRETGLLREDNVRVVGKPSLEEAVKAARTFPSEQAQKIFEKFELSPLASPVILFAGGRDEAYKAFFPIFVEGIKTLDVQVWLTYHPATDASFEKEIITREGTTNIKLIQKDETLGLTNPTAQLLPFAKVMACVQTSADLIAARLGVPLLYVNKRTYHPTLLDLGALASTPAEVRETLQRLLEKAPKIDLEGGSIGLPEAATKTIARFVMSHLSS